MIKRLNKIGQNAIEYMLIVATVTVVLVAAAGPKGFLTQRINKALDLSVGGIETMANCVCYQDDPSGCNPRAPCSFSDANAPLCNNNHVCDAGEDCVTCGDCSCTPVDGGDDGGGTDGGDGTDGGTGSTFTCPGNGCERVLGENCENCPQDCGSCCGDGACDPTLGECVSCLSDCRPNGTWSAPTVSSTGCMNIFGLCRKAVATSRTCQNPTPECPSAACSGCNAIGGGCPNTDIVNSFTSCSPGESCCGNTAIEAGEQCDDGNAVDEDGCSSSCQIELAPGCPADSNHLIPFCGTFSVPAQLDGGSFSGVCTSANCDFTVICNGGTFEDTLSNCRVPVCGNGVPDLGEQCDDGNTTNGDGCSSSCKLETGSNCPAESNFPIALCGTLSIPAMNDGESFTATCTDSNCDFIFHCTDGLIEPGGFSNCRAPVCGNGDLEFGEQCDDGNTTNGDGCSSGCDTETVSNCPAKSNFPIALCGTLSIPAMNDGESFTATCTDSNCDFIFHCTDGLIEPGGFSNCRAPVCGNGNIELGEQCDDGNTANGDGCSSGCQIEVAACGDGTVQSGEQCDDGNTANGDGCSSGCQLEPPRCGDGRIDPGEQCDDGNTVDTDVCTNLCLNAVCGDNSVQSGVEQCDDGGTDPEDGCSPTCQNETSICGNLIIDPGEFCDDGNRLSSDGCSSSCQLEPLFCGDNLCDLNEGVNPSPCPGDCTCNNTRPVVRCKIQPDYTVWTEGPTFDKCTRTHHNFTVRCRNNPGHPDFCDTNETITVGTRTCSPTTRGPRACKVVNNTKRCVQL